MNVCGYDQELQSSSPIRMEVRADLVEASKLPHGRRQPKRCAASIATIGRAMRRTTWRNMSLWRSILAPPPDFAPKLKEADMPPDAAYVLGFVPLLKQYYAAANLHSIWLKHQPEYLALIDQYHGPVAQMINSTDNYLRMPMSGYSGRSFTVYLGADGRARPGELAQLSAGLLLPGGFAGRRTTSTWTRCGTPICTSCSIR